MMDMMDDMGMGSGQWLWMLIFAVVFVIPVWRICTRAGFPGIISLLSLVPIVNLLFLYYLAFAPWPRDRSMSR